MIIHKFGGSSLANAARFIEVAEILSRTPGTMAVVVSAIGGVTNDLSACVSAAAARDPSYPERLAALRAVHVTTARELLSAAEAASLIDMFESDFEELSDVLRAAWLLREASRGTFDMAMGYGEIWSAQLLDSLLRQIGLASVWLNARDVLVVQNTRDTPEIRWEESRERLSQWKLRRPSDHNVVVITGYVAATSEGVPATLGRNGSDYSASIFAALLDAAEIHIWSDVDGVMSADPRFVPDAVLLDSISYHEASELAYFGAKILHPATMGPAVERSIPIRIRNTFNPDGRGTRIHVSGSEQMVKGLSTVEAVALVNVEGIGLSAIGGLTDRLFAALRQAAITTLMVSQGSSQHSICIAVPEADAVRVADVLEAAFYAERHQGQIETIEVDVSCSLLAVVGDGMAGHPGVAARFFGSLGKAGVNIRAIAQGSSERNISVVVERPQSVRALRAAHSGLYLSSQSISIGVFGIGTVGGALLDQLAERADAIRHELGIDLRVRAISDSRMMHLAARRVEIKKWREQMNGTVPLNLDAFLEHVQTDTLPHSVIVDCTSSEQLARSYADWLRRGIHVVTPNKKAGSSDFAYFNELRQASRESNAHFLYETTVGAGLPVLQTLRDLTQTGDEVLKVEGVLSGTLSYLFNSFDGSRPFSSVVAEARQQGFTEPDPREDLSGMDVARKVVILAREMGLCAELGDVELQGLIPRGLEDGTVAEFFEALPYHDHSITTLFEAAKSRNERLRFVGSIARGGKARVRLESVPASHPLARLHLTDNLVQFQTSRYSPNPLIVQGPGAGPQVTAAGIFADILRLAAFLGTS